MALIVLLGSLIASSYIFKKKRALVRSGRSNSPAVKLADRVFELTASLGIILLFYHALLVSIRLGWKWITVEDLERLEKSLTIWQQLADRYKVSWAYSMGIVVMLYLLGSFWIRFLERDTPFRVFKKAKEILHIINTVLFLLASFTLLGFEPGKAAATLQIQLHRSREAYGLLRHEADNVLSSAVLSRSCEQALQALPSGSRALGLIRESEVNGA